MIAIALIFLGNGLANEAHDLITPLSWSDDTYFGGPTLFPHVDDSVVAMASYAHSLLHRMEGLAQGEFGMMGYQNANYWASATRSRAENNSNSVETSSTRVTFQVVRDAILDLSETYGDDARSWCKKYIIEEGGVDNVEYWETRALHELCASISRDDQESRGLKIFAEKAAEIELRILLNVCLECAGYEVEYGFNKEEKVNAPTTVATVPNLESIDIDTDLAQSICNRVLSAHIGGFQSSNSVILRRMVKSFEVNNNTIAGKMALSAAAGIACRLLTSHAVKLSMPSEKNNSILVILPNDKNQEEKCLNHVEKVIGRGGGALAIGDEFAYFSTGNANDMLTLLRNEEGFFVFTPCAPTDDEVVFIDRFNGSRGDTPTSVLQWSKGIVHRSTYKRECQ